MTRAKNMTLSPKVLSGLSSKMKAEPWLKDNLSRTVDEMLYKSLLAEGYIDLDENEKAGDKKP